MKKKLLCVILFLVFTGVFMMGCAPLNGGNVTAAEVKPLISAGIDIGGEFYSFYNTAEDIPASLGGTVVTPRTTGGSQPDRSFGASSDLADAGTNWSLIDGRRDAVKVTGDTYVYQDQVTSDRYYIEAFVDPLKCAAVSENLYGQYIAGLLLSHGPGALNGAGSPLKIIASVIDNKLCYSFTGTGWNIPNTIAAADLKAIAAGDEPVKLGALRDRTDYYLFVNDNFVHKFTYEHITTVSGFGIASNRGIAEFTGFNYSIKQDTLDALIIFAQETTAQKAEGILEDIDVYLIAGQSNAAGLSNFTASRQAFLDDNKDNLTGYGNVYYYGQAITGSAASPAPPQVNTGSILQLTKAGLGHNGNSIGPELGMANVLSEAYGEKSVGIIKLASGGTSLFDNIQEQNAAHGNWCPPSYHASINTQPLSNELTGGLYRLLLDTVKDADFAYREQGYRVRVKGLYWMQGESNRGNTALYKTMVKMFISDLRKDLSVMTGENLYGMPVFIGEISETYFSAAQAAVNNNLAFIQMQNDLTLEVPDVYIINSSVYKINTWDNDTSVVVGSDQHHWNAQDIFEIGKLIGGSIVTNILRN